MGISNVTSNIRSGVCTSTTRPTAPYEGQVIYETDTDKVYTYNGSNWVLVYTTNGGPVVFQSTPPTDTNVLWADTSIGGSNTAVPVGGTTGQVLTKSTSTDYDTSWTGPMGLVLVKTTAIVAGASQSFPSVFSASYDVYRVIINMKTTAQGALLLTMGGTTSNTSGWYAATTYWSYTGTPDGLVRDSNAAYTQIALTDNGLWTTCSLDIHYPYLSENTLFSGTTWGRARYMGTTGGQLSNTTSYTGFTLANSSGNLSSGTVYVYGYLK